jgi:hypothetical protein
VPESLTAEKGARLMRRTAAKQELNGISPATSQEKIELVKWHINRYDRLRGSTTNRAAVVLSAGAILSAGVAVALSQLLSNSAELKGWPLTVFSVGAAATALLLVLSLILAMDALISLRRSIQLLPDPTRPRGAGLIFDGADTIDGLKSFADFSNALKTEVHEQTLDRALAELWTLIRQHRHRYRRLRGAVRALRYAAILFLAVLIGLIITNAVLRS